MEFLYAAYSMLYRQGDHSSNVAGPQRTPAVGHLDLPFVAERKYVSFRRILLAVLMIIGWLLSPSVVSAKAIINLRPHLCLALQPGEHLKQEQPSTSSCNPVWSDRANRWTRVQLDDPRRLDPLPAGWHMLLPHRNLDGVMVVIKYRDGKVERLTRPNGALSVDWSPGGHARFAPSRRGTDVASLSISYKSNRASSTIRYVKAVPAHIFEAHAANFNLVVGLFLGTVGSALIYNLFIGAGRRRTFQRIYIVWSILALLNGLLASGGLNELWPALAEPTGVLANKVVLAALFASGTLFFLALIEKDVLPQALIRLGLANALAMAATGPLWAIEPWMPFDTVGKLATLFTACNIAFIAAAASVAARGGSRAV